ncbi:MAG TPA: hypothetical protein VHP35_15350 [Terriglobia bacterium]|nr:hypothetical protein [Terriglobia bacterium]
MSEVLVSEAQQVKHVVDDCPFLWSSVDEPFETRVAMLVQGDDFTIKSHVVERTDCLSNDRENAS